MAKKPDPQTPADAPKPVVDDTLPDTEKADSPETVSDDAQTDSIDLPEPGKDATDAPVDEPVAADSDDDIAPEAETEGDTSDPAEIAAPEPAPAPAPERVIVEKRGGFLPLALGGVVAAGIGFAAAYGLDLKKDDGAALLAQKIDAQNTAIADLKAAIPPAVDLAPVTAKADSNAAAIADLSGRIEGMVSQLADLTARVTQIEETPIAEGVSEQARAAYEQELARLQDAMAKQRGEVEDMVAAAQTMKADAAARSSETQARAALTRILSAIDSGEPFAEPLAELQATGTEIPTDLAAGATGVPTLSQLREDYPPAARNALAVTRGAGNGSVADFFKTQLGIRSLAPRDGDDPDAILSRAEAALATGNLAQALTEIDTLPPAAKAELQAWAAAAQTRMVTRKAANGLMADLNSK